MKNQQTFTKIKQVWFLLVLIIILVGCTPKQEIKAVKSKFVKLFEIEDIVTSEIRTFPGKVVESKKANLAFRISAPIEKILVEEGEYVKSGQVIATLDSRDYQLQLEAAKAQYEQITSEVARIKTLYKKGNISENDYEKAESGLKLIQAKYQSAQNALKDIKLVAPYSGFIQEIYFQTGEIVKAGLPVITLIGDENFQIECDIPAVVYSNRDKFESFSVILETNPTLNIPLELVNIKHKSNLNSLYHVYFKIEGNQQPDLRLAVGMACEVEISYALEYNEDEQIIKVPIQSIIEESEVNYVWLCTADSAGEFRVNKKQIKVVGIDESGFALISNGLEIGSNIVKAGIYGLNEGQIVKPVEEITPTNYGGLL